jgi:hypothetical protein
MARSVSLVVWSSILLACVPPALRGQSTPCVATGPDTLSDAVWNMRRRYNGPDSATTINAGRLWASRNQIYAVTDSTTCVQAVAAYNAATNTPGAVTEAYVVRIGNGAFVVVDQVAAPGGRHAYWLFSPAWALQGPPVDY